MDHSQFSHANKNEKFFSAVVKLLHKAEDNTHSKVQNTLEFKLTIAKKTTFMAEYATGSRKYARSHTTKNSQKNYGIEVKSFGQNRLEEYTHCLSNLDYGKNKKFNCRI